MLQKNDRAQTEKKKICSVNKYIMTLFLLAVNSRFRIKDPLVLVRFFVLQT